MDRRTVLTGLAATAMGGSALAQHAGHPPSLKEAAPSPAPYSKLGGGGFVHHLEPSQESQRVFDSPAPKGPAGRWIVRAPLPLPRSEMAWATAWAGRMHIVGG